VRIGLLLHKLYRLALVLLRRCWCNCRRFQGFVFFISAPCTRATKLQETGLGYAKRSRH